MKLSFASLIKTLFILAVVLLRCECVKPKTGVPALVSQNLDLDTLLQQYSETTNHAKTKRKTTKAKKTEPRGDSYMLEKEVNAVAFNKKIESCSDAPVNGIYQILLPGFEKVIQVRCEVNFEKKKGNWIVIQRRIDGLVNFFRSWDEYKRGFGDLEGEFFYGLEKIYRLTNSVNVELGVIFTSGTRNAWATFSSFRVGSESEKYRLTSIGSFKGVAGDALDYHRGMPFSTYDRKNDDHDDENCAITCHGGWWYRKCYQSNLNGRYTKDKGVCDKCLKWNPYFKNEPITFVQMMLRPVEDDDHDDWANAR